MRTFWHFLKTALICGLVLQVATAAPSEDLLNFLRSQSEPRSENSFLVTQNSSGQVTHLTGNLDLRGGDDLSVATKRFLGSYGSLLGVEEPGKQLQESGLRSGAQGTRHLSYQQIYKGIPVWNHLIRFHTDIQGNLSSMSSNFVVDLDLDTVPTLSADAVVDLLATSFDDSAVRHKEIALVIYMPESPRVGDPRLAYVVDAAVPWDARRLVFDAHTGETLAEYTLLLTDGPATGSGSNLLGETVDSLHIYEGDTFDWGLIPQWLDELPPTGPYNMVDASRPERGMIYTITSHNTDMTDMTFVSSATTAFDSADEYQSHPSGVSAHDYHRKTLNYYWDAHGHAGMDGNGYSIISYIDIGPNWQNAMHSIYDHTLRYGTGGGNTRPYCAAIDIVAHEFTHAVTNFSSGLVYANDAGAINESLSDVFGYLVEARYQNGGDWLEGEDLYYSGGAMRSFEHPPLYDQPDHLNHFQYVNPLTNPNSSNDYGGVHTNSGIPNKVFYLVVQGGTHYGYDISPLDSDLDASRDIAANIWYTWNTQYMVVVETYQSAAFKMLQVVSDLYPGNSDYLNTIYTAWLSVGVDSYAPLLILTSQVQTIVAGDGDGVLNPGETVTISPELTNESLNDAVAVTGILNCQTEGIVIEPAVMDFGAIPAGEIGLAAEPGFTLELAEAVMLGDPGCLLEIDATSTGGGVTRFNILLDLNISLLQDGWPLVTNQPVSSSPVVIDLDNGEGPLEIIFGDNEGLLHVTDAMGVEREGFPFDTGDDIWGSPAVADLENDGDLEIVVGSKSKHLYILDSDGEPALDINVGLYVMGTPALGDVDGDEELEIVVGTYGSPTSSNQILVLNPDGSAVEGFPYNIGEKVQKGVALADINDNGRMDIICGTDSENIHLILDDGTLAPGFPFAAEGDFRTPPTVLELPDDQQIILAGSKDDTYYGIYTDGSLYFSITATSDITTTTAFVEDMEWGTVLLFGTGDGQLFAITPEGENLTGWPVTIDGSIEGSCAVSDLDSDGQAEIVLVTSTGMVQVLHLDGTVFPHFPLTNEFTFESAPLITDIDDDGDLEILAGNGGGLSAIDVKIAGGVTTDYWNIFRGSYLRQGYYTSAPIDYLPGDLNDDSVLDILDILLMVDLILGEDPPANLLMVADITEDGIVDILDIAMLLWIIVGD